MSAVTVMFLVIGGTRRRRARRCRCSVGELLHFGHPDADGRSRVPAVAGFVGAFGFAGAIASELLGAGTPARSSAAAGVGRGRGAAHRVPGAAAGPRRPQHAHRRHADPRPTWSAPRRGGHPDPGRAATARSGSRIGGQPVKLNARADRPVPLGAQVFVVEAPSDTSVIVEEIPEPLAPPIVEGSP